MAAPSRCVLDAAASAARLDVSPSMYRADTSSQYSPPGVGANVPEPWRVDAARRGRRRGSTRRRCRATPTRRRAVPSVSRRTLVAMWSQRSVTDYALARRATLAALFGGSLTTTDVCDAHPYLLRAAKYHGEPTTTACPVCRKERLTHVTYVYGDEL